MGSNTRRQTEMIMAAKSEDCRIELIMINVESKTI